MKKNVLTLITAILLCVGLTACGDGSKPFKEYVDYSYEYTKEIIENPDLLKDEGKVKSMEEKLNKLLLELNEKTIKVEVEDGLGYELLSDEGKIENVKMGGGLFVFTIIADAKKIGDGPGTLMGVICDEKGGELYAQTIDVKHKENDNARFEYYVSVQKQGLFFFGEAAKLVIMKMDAQRRDGIIKINSERIDKIMAKLKGEEVDEDSNTETEKGGLVFNGKLGPVEVGKPMPSLPQNVDGLYDKFDHKTVEHEDEMDGPWTEDFYLFTKNGKEIFRANIFEGKVFSIRLLSGSSFIKTPDGFSVGSSARELFKKVRMEWQNYYEGEAFGTNGHFSYYVNSDDLIQTDIPQKEEHFKQDAKITGIVYQ